uniref:DH domain-containing protein n=1 Tax=Pyxicephalus adspersus TaxID=30357 RepID=A0AAV3ARF8_PYXAD|nr:TPA: hypothetical protein GDO54_005804 [Pyxicephalus adspersus]
MKEEKTQQKKEEPMGVKAKVDGEREDDRSCPPPLPPKLFQDPDERPAKMASCPPRPACPSKCCCACHQQRPGFVLVWVPESSVAHGLNISETLDSCDGGGIFQRASSLNDDDDGGKWGPRLLKDKMTGGTSYPVRRRSLRYGERSKQNSADGVGEEKVNSGVVLTSYKSMVECNFNSDPTCEDAGGSQGEIPKSDSAPEVPKHGTAFSWKMKGGGDVESSVDTPLSNLHKGPSLEHSNGYAPIVKPSKLKSISFSDQVVPITDKEMSSASGDSAESLASCTSDSSQSVSEPPTLREAGEDQTGELRVKIRKPARRSKVPPTQSLCETMEKNPQFHAVLCRLQELPQCQRLPFMSFLLLPFQRITRIKMLIENILKRTEEGSESEQNASKALDAVSTIIQECNREVGRMRQTEELIHISSKIEFDKIKAVPIISQSRFLEKQGELSEVHQKGSLFGIKPTKLTPVYFFLFNDFLLITQRKSSDRHVAVDYAHRSLVQLQSCPTMDNSFFLTLLENHQGKTCDRLFKAPTQ